MIAILEDAMTCAKNVFKKGGTGGDPELEMAMAWFDDENAEYLFSFESICDVLEIRSQDVRARLDRLRWKHEPEPHTAPQATITNLRVARKCAVDAGRLAGHRPAAPLLDQSLLMA